MSARFVCAASPAGRWEKTASFGEAHLDRTRAAWSSVRAMKTFTAAVAFIVATLPSELRANDTYDLPSKAYQEQLWRVYPEMRPAGPQPRRLLPPTNTINEARKKYRLLLDQKALQVQPPSALPSQLDLPEFKLPPFSLDVPQRVMKNIIKSK